jgi:PAS domain S-box-containing protein
MKLSTRMTIAMAALVLLTTVAVGGLTYRNLEAVMLPRSLDRVQLDLRLLTTDLASYVGGARQDIVGFRSAVAMQGIVRAHLGGGTDAADNIGEAAWRRRLAERFATELAAKPAYDKFRVIGFDNGRELIRVDRSGPDGAIRIVPDEELEYRGDRKFFGAAGAMPADNIYVSPVQLNLNKAGTAVLTPHVPVLRVAATIPYPGQIKPFGLVIIDVDMRPILQAIESSARLGGKIYVVDENGNYLVHPDPSLEFGSDLGRPTHWQNDFPELASGFQQDHPSATLITHGAGEKAVGGVSAIRLAGGPRVGVLAVTPQALILAPAAAVGRSTLLVGSIAFLCAGLLAVLLARSMTQPLVQMTEAVEAFPRDQSATIPTGAGGELGVLARAFRRMMTEVKEKTAALQTEVEERRRTELELKRHTDQERLFSAAVESSEDAIVTMTVDGIVTGWNPAAVRLFGWSGADMLGRSVDVIVPDDRRSEVRGILEKIRRGDSVDHHETVRLRKDRRLTEVSLSVSPIKSPSGAIIGACKIARDITESKKAKASLEQESAERRRIAEILDNTITSMSDAVLVADEKGTILLSNPAARRLLGIAPGMTAETWPQAFELFLEDGVTPLSWQEGPLLRAVRGEMIANFDIVIKHRDTGKSISLVANGGPIQAGSQKKHGGMVVYRDITAAKESERQLRHAQKMEALGQLTGGIAHDFNNILTVITGTIEILGAGVADRPDLLEITAMINDAAERGAELTQHLLAFSRQQPLEPRETDVNELIAASAQLLRPTLGEDIEIESMLDESVSAAMIDPTQLTTTLLNLALNARDAMPNGGKLTLETSDVILDEHYARMNAEVVPGPYVMIAVSDTGTGIAADILDKVFDPFFTTKDVDKGTGLGLSMVYGFVKQSSGHIKIYSEPGHGTVVKMYLPRAKERPQQAAADAVIETVRGGSETVLVVEDDALVRKHAVAQVLALGYTALAANNAAEALALVDERADIDLLFTDIVMPLMNGRQLADEAIKRRPRLKVLYTSGYTEDALVHHGRLDAGVLLLAKPYRRTDLARMIRLALDVTAEGGNPASAQTRKSA